MHILCISCAYPVHSGTSYDGELQGHLSYDFDKLPRSTTESRASTPAKEVQDCGDKNVLKFIGEERVTNVSWQRHNLFYSAKACAVPESFVPTAKGSVLEASGCSTELRVPPMGRQIHDAE